MNLPIDRHLGEEITRYLLKNKSEENSEEGDSDEISSAEDEFPPRIKRRNIHVGAWRNKEEFVMVHNWLFGNESTYETRKEAYDQMRIWKIRRSVLTPAAVLCTLLILEVQLKDETRVQDNRPDGELEIFYSSAIIRFLNHITSIVKHKCGRNLKKAAKSLGIADFIVDLRNTFSHTCSLAELNLLRYAGNYCMTWLKNFYWDPQKKNMKNVTGIELIESRFTKLDWLIIRKLKIYDIICEVMTRNCIKVKEAKKYLSFEDFKVVREFSKSNQSTELKKLLQYWLKEFGVLLKRRMKSSSGIDRLMGSLVNMEFFLNSPATRIQTLADFKLIIKIHQPLLQLLAMNQLMKDLFDKLIKIGENNNEPEAKRKSACFWAHQIVLGFIGFRNFKKMCLKIVNSNHEKQFTVDPNNPFTLSKKIQKVYKMVNIDVHSTLIFGNSMYNMWSLYFYPDYFQKRIINVNELTIDILKDSLPMVVSMKSREKKDLSNLMDIYVGQLTSKNNHEEEKQEGNEMPSKIHTVADLQSNSEKENCEAGEKRSIWTKVENVKPTFLWAITYSD